MTGFDAFNPDGESLNSLPIGLELADLGPQFGHKTRLVDGGSISFVPVGEGAYEVTVTHGRTTFVFGMRLEDVQSLRSTTGDVVLHAREEARA